MAKSQFLASVALEEREPARVVVESERIMRSGWFRLWERPRVRKIIRAVSAVVLVAVFIASGRVDPPLGLLLSPVMASLLAIVIWQISRDSSVLAKGAVWMLTHFAWFFALLLVVVLGLLAALLALAPSRPSAIGVGVIMLIGLSSAKGVLSDAAGGRRVRLRAAWLLHLLSLVTSGFLTVLVVAAAIDSAGVRNISGVMATVGVGVVSALLLSARSWAARNRKVRTLALESAEEALMAFDAERTPGLRERTEFCHAILSLDRALGTGVDLGNRWLRTPLETPSYRVVLLRYACAHSGHELLHDVNRAAGVRAVGYCEQLSCEDDPSKVLKVELRRLADWLRRDVDVAL